MSIYSLTLEKALLPLHNLVRRRRYVRYRALLEESQWWPREKLVQFQWQELKALLSHVFQAVPYYQKKYGAAGLRLEDIRTWQDFHRLPVLTREEVNANRAELCAKGYDGKLLPHATGGSTGVPTRFYITYESYDWRTAATQRAYSWSGCRLGERSLYLWGAPVGDQTLFQTFKKSAYEFLQRQLICSTFSQSYDGWRSIYARARRFQPRLVVGYVSSLDAFARFLRDSGCSLPTVRAVIAAAEPLHGDVRDRVTTALGAPVFNTYGSREFMSLAGECEHHDGLHVNVENVLLETLRPPEDGPSDVLITDLHNLGMPFVRYAIGDVGLLDDSPCPCGRALPRLRSIDGRVLDVLRTTDGRVVPGEFFPHLLKEIPEIREYQVEQTAPRSVVVSVVLTAELSDASRRLVARETQKVFGDGAAVELKRVESIPRLAAGKRRVTIGLPSPVCQAGAPRPL